MATSRLESGDFRMRTGRQDAAQVETVEQVLREVHDLLELYAPVWYSERFQQRINSALSHSGSHPGAL